MVQKHKNSQIHISTGRNVHKMPNICQKMIKETEAVTIKSNPKKILQQAA